MHRQLVIPPARLSSVARLPTIDLGTFSNRAHPEIERGSILLVVEVCGNSRSGIALEPERYYAEDMKTVSLKLENEVLEQLEREARLRGVTKSELLREGLKRILNEDSPTGAESCYDLARDLAGVVKGLPEDLAVNPKYMKGFGR